MNVEVNMVNNFLNSSSSCRLFPRSLPKKIRTCYQRLIIKLFNKIRDKNFINLILFFLRMKIKDNFIC